METDYVAVIGPQSSMVAHSMSYIANERQVPLLSFSATDPTLSSPQFPYFIRTTQSDLYQMEAIAEIVEYYGWREVISIFLDDDYGRNEVSEFDDALAARRCKISFKAGVPPATGASRSDIMDILVKVALMEPRVIVLHVNPNVGFTVFSVASYLGMMRDGYVWIATDWLSSVLDSSFPLPSDTMDSMQGVLVLRHHTPDSERKRAFLDRWKKLTGGSLGLNAYALYAYDTVWLIAHALNSFLDQGGVISFSNDSKLSSAEWSNPHLEALSIFDGGPHLLSNILQSDFIGLTGPIKFNSERSLILPAYDIINVLGTGFRQIGYWSNHSGLSTLAPDTLYSRAPNRSSANHKLHNVIWPGDPKAKPRGWAFPNNGKVLKIGVPWRISFREFVSLVPGTDAFEGFCIDVFSAAVNLLPYALPYKFVPYGDGHKNPSYTELVSQVTAGMFDGAVGDIGIVSNRTKMVDFTQPYVSSGLVVVAPYKKLNTGAWAFLRPFSRRMWGVTAVSSLIVGIIVWILERRINNEFRGPPKTQLVTILWFGISTLFLGHKENTLSNSLGRMVLLIWLFVVLVINSSYTASLTSILTVQQLYSPIKGIESLKHGDDPIGYQVGSFAENYLIEVIGIAKTRLVPVGSPEEYLELLQRGPKEGGVAAVVDERPYVELFLSSRCKFRTVSLLEFTRNGWGFAFPRDSPLAVDLSTAILRLSENGDLQRIHDRWFNKSSCIFDKADTESDRLHLGSFEGLFLICGIAFFIGLSIFFIQIMLEFRKAARADPISLGHGSSCSRRLRKLLYLIDEKKDQSNRDKKRRKIERSVSDDDADQEIDLGRNLRRQSQISVDNNID